MQTIDETVRQAAVKFADKGALRFNADYPNTVEFYDNTDPDGPLGGSKGIGDRRMTARMVPMIPARRVERKVSHRVNPIPSTKR